MSSEERALFARDMDANVLLKNEYEAYKSIWEITNSLGYESENISQSWSNFESSVTEKPNNFLNKYWLVSLAASIIIIAFVSFSILNLVSDEFNFETSHYIENYELDDHTQVILNPNSKLILSNDFNTFNREVTLSGEAYFSVVKSNKKFIVHTAIGDIVVHGTQFKVSVNEENQSIVVELFNGRLSYFKNSQEYHLESGEILTSSSDKVSKSTSNIIVIDDGYVVCKNTTLANILAQIDLIYGVDYHIKPKLLENVYTVTLPRNNLENCIKILNQISGNNFALIDNSIVLK
jgi:ferric-dicitrate binding protein FerR (iron transport regulator)